MRGQKKINQPHCLATSFCPLSPALNASSARVQRGGEGSGEGGRDLRRSAAKPGIRDPPIAHGITASGSHPPLKARLHQPSVISLLT
ncbi:hypothetical protein K227x_07760 [Rubripirellula lacrimiformis]|uniref:Uncharacterized protein n=1 Tax=Rubripirellula lacrimiformis TaxID=1930273 RepID=A0A517N5I7_9BACT|nr:hypothetical protein K227x_07760 [Rubripirellula lacrimiformis]